MNLIETFPLKIVISFPCVAFLFVPIPISHKTSQNHVNAMSSICRINPMFLQHLAIPYSVQMMKG